MNKVSVPATNDFCPQTMFLYGTYKEDGAPNFGLFCWFSYCWDDGLCVMACIGGEKLTMKRIQAAGVFSANLVTKSMLPLADFAGSVPGEDPRKANYPFEITQGSVLNVPILEASPVSYELEVKKAIPLDGSIVMICKVRNVLRDEKLSNEDQDILNRMLQVNPVYTTHQTYFSITGERLGAWGDWKDNM
jgi:flavin reductase (DIM6/NTAB) family NADH-FMN oxidoreductase RutF